MNRAVARPALAIGRPARIRILTQLARMWRVWQNRRQVSNLLGADDHMLADIGLTRADVEGALEVPLPYDPSLHLVRARQERRSGRVRRF